MSEEKESQGNLFRVKADGTGVDVSVGTGVPTLFARLIPTKWRFRRAADDEICDGILRKLRSGSDLNEAEFAFAENLLSEGAKKFLRLTSIERRAQALNETRPVLLEGVSPKDTGLAETSDDWVNKFREDAALVDDDLVREIYARVLSEEHRAPGAFSLRTLGVLRYLDCEAATAFGQLQKVLVDSCLVPRQGSHVLEQVGLNHETMLMLNDAGLVYSLAQTGQDIEGDRIIFVLTGHGRAVAARHADNRWFKVKLEIHLLTPAGQQLARIAQCEPDEHAFVALVDWLRPKVGDAQLFVAELPARDWRGRPELLTWRPLNEEAAQQVVAD